ncbi:MAG: T9SS type A sorting domain-containing protein [Ignavibacteria bacterium]|nr:T9SS type A sorting domain-containing protein [Ignavibacteria bacterium]
MKGILSALILFFVLLLQANYSESQILYNENFNYTAGDSLGAHGWVSFSGGSTNVLSVTTPGLTYTGYPGSGIGNAVTVNASGQDAYTSLSAIDSSNSFYAAAMINVTSAQAGDYFMAFLPSTSTTFYSGRLHARLSGGNLGFGITKGAATDTTTAGIWTTANYSLNTTYFVVLKYTFVEGTGNDQVSLFVLSSTIPTTEPTPTVGPITYPSGDAFNLGRIALRQGTSTRAPVLKIDGIRVTRSWSSILTSIVNQTSTIPDNFKLSQNYPNPFNPSTVISFTLPEAGLAVLKVYDYLGREVSSLINNSFSAGTYETKFDGSGLSSGVYFYRLDVTGSSGSNYSDSKKLILNK